MISERDSVYHLRTNFKKVLPKSSPNCLQKKIHKRWPLSWINVIVMIRVTTFECFKMQMVINLAPVSLSNEKSELLHLPKIDFSAEKCHGKHLEEHF